MNKLTNTNSYLGLWVITLKFICDVHYAYMHVYIHIYIYKYSREVEGGYGAELGVVSKVKHAKRRQLVPVLH